jgi:predicted nucleotidyltransferase
LNDGLTGAQRAIAARVIAEEEPRRAHLVVALSGAHAYGFPSPDSDLDLKAIHIEPTSRLLGLSPPRPSVDRMEVIEGVEIDYTSNELQGALAGILSGNGNYIERILGPLLLQVAPEHATLRPLVQRALSRRIFHHYRGFATSQIQALDKGGTAKRVLYVLRTTLTGTHGLLTGEIVTDVNALLDEYGFAEARELIEAKRAGERVVLASDRLAHWRAELTRAHAALRSAGERSCLPEEPPNVEELEAWLLEVRRRRF